MKLDVLHVNGCPSYSPALRLLKRVLREEGVAAEICTIEVHDAAAARALDFIGSPTIRIDGVDVDSDADAGKERTRAGLACRWYPGGLPSEAKIRAKVREARER